jgi:hypothetical protein
MKSFGFLRGSLCAEVSEPRHPAAPTTRASRRIIMQVEIDISL